MESNANHASREYGSEIDVECLTGYKRRTLQKDRHLGRGFPFYKVRGKVLYDLQEIRTLIRAGRVEVRNDGGTA